MYSYNVIVRHTRYLSHKINSEIRENILDIGQYNGIFKTWNDVEYSLHLLGESTELMLYLESTVTFRSNFDALAEQLNIKYDYCIDSHDIITKFWLLKYKE